jgi:type VI secretion system protein ImpE
VFDPPADLRDTVWTPASFTWANGADTVGLVPTRYTGTVDTGSDGLMLARRTEWTGQGNPVGQRMLVTDTGEYALMDVRVIEFDAVGMVDAVEVGETDLAQHG